MSNNTLLFLAMSQNTNHAITSRGDERVQQYINGIEKLFEYDFTNKADVLVCDNTTSHLDKRIIRVLPWNTEYYTYENNTGGVNTGVGLFDQWKTCLKIIGDYKWIIHFEPRQMIKEFTFFDSFFRSPRNLFKIHTNDFCTGLFSLDVKIFTEYLQSCTLKPQESIETSIYKFMNNYEYETEKLNLLWNDVATNRWIDI